MNVLLFPVLGHAFPAGEGIFLSGLSHPVLGLDHLLAMVAVGLLAVRGTAEVRWWIPGAFLAGMVAGGVLGIFPVLSEPAEGMIVLSMAVFGVVLAVSVRGLERFLPWIVGGFAVFHGHAHVLEGPAGLGLAVYGVGFLLGTAGLMAGGVLGGLICREVPRGSWGLRLAGAGVVVMSLIFFLQ